MILNAKLTERHARALLKIQSEEVRQKALETIITNNLNVSQTESLIESLVSKNEPKEPKRKTYKSLSSFYEAINRAIDTASNSGIKIKSRKIESDGYTEISILVPIEKLESKPDLTKEIATV